MDTAIYSTVGRISYPEKFKSLTITERNKYDSSSVLRLTVCLQIEIESTLYTSYFPFRVMLPSLGMADVKLVTI